VSIVYVRKDVRKPNNAREAFSSTQFHDSDISKLKSALLIPRPD
jgi:hypothetical protein